MKMMMMFTGAFDRNNTCTCGPVSSRRQEFGKADSFRRQLLLASLFTVFFAFAVSVDSGNNNNEVPRGWPFASASGPSFDGFESEEELKTAVFDFMEWFKREYAAAHEQQGEDNTEAAVHPRDRETERSAPPPPLAVTLAYGGPSLRLGVFAIRDIPAETPYLSIPLKMIISRATIEMAGEEEGGRERRARGGAHAHAASGQTTPMSIGSVLKESWGRVRAPDLNPHFATLGLYLLHEKFVAGPNSRFFPYIRLLPQRHDTPEYYTDTELEAINGTALYRQTLRRRETTKLQYEWLKQNFFPKYPSLFPSWAATYEKWRWVMGILESRMIWWDGAPHLVPLLDMVNCRAFLPTLPLNVNVKSREQRRAELQVNSNNKAATTSPKDTTTEVVSIPKPVRVHRTFRRGDEAVTLAPVTFPKGSQIFENYGQPNPTYFLFHGFVLAAADEENKDEIERPTSTIQQEQSSHSSTSSTMMFNNVDCAEMDVAIGSPLIPLVSRSVSAAVVRTLGQMGIGGGRGGDSSICISATNMRDLLAVARVFTAEKRSATGGKLRRGRSVGYQDAVAPLLHDLTLEKASLVHAGKAVNASLTYLEGRLAFANAALKRAVLGSEKGEKTSKTSVGRVPSHAAVDSSVFRTKMTRAFLAGQVSILREVRLQLIETIRALGGKMEKTQQSNKVTENADAAGIEGKSSTVGNDLNSDIVTNGERTDASEKRSSRLKKSTGHEYEL